MCGNSRQVEPCTHALLPYNVRSLIHYIKRPCRLPNSKMDGAPQEPSFFRQANYISHTQTKFERLGSKQASKHRFSFFKKKTRHTHLSCMHTVITLPSDAAAADCMHSVRLYILPSDRSPYPLPINPQRRENPQGITETRSTTTTRTTTRRPRAAFPPSCKTIMHPENHLP